MARRWGTTRAAAAVSLWGPSLQEAVVAIGNAPTALFHLLEMIADCGSRLAAIVGIPVGFLGSVESKVALAEHVLPGVARLRGSWCKADAGLGDGCGGRQRPGHPAEIL